MKNNIITMLAAVAIPICALLLPDQLIYWITLFMAMAVIGAMRIWHSKILSLTRWAKAHPNKAQWLIAGIQIILMSAGLLSGLNLKELGLSLTNSTAYVFSALLALGFLSVHFRPKRDVIAIPKIVENQRLGYLTISLASLMMMVFTGNRISDIRPDSLLSRTLEDIDAAMYKTLPADTGLQSPWTEARQATAYPLALASLKVTDGETIERPNRSTDRTALKKAAKENRQMMREEKKLERQAQRDNRKWWRLATTAGMCALGIFLIILLIGTTCAGVCLLIFAISGEASVGYGLLGALITGLSIWGIVEAAKLCKKDKT